MNSPNKSGKSWEVEEEPPEGSFGYDGLCGFSAQASCLPVSEVSGNEGVKSITHR